MKEVNGYYKSYNEQNNHLDYLKYGLNNEYGPNINHYEKECYNESELIKTKCHTKKKK